MMNLWLFLLVSLGIFALLQFLWIPSTEYGLSADRSATTIGRAGFLSVLGFLRGVFLISTITATLLTLVVLILQARGGTTTQAVAASISSLQAWRLRLLGFGSLWGASVTAVLIFALAIYARRSGQRRMTKIFQRAYERELAKIKSDYELGKLKELPPTAEMLQILAKVSKVNISLTRLEMSGVPNVETLQEWQELIGQLYLLEQYYKALDIQRRLPIDFNMNPDDAELPEPHTTWEKIQTFFISRGLLASLSGGTRALFLASLILLVPSLTGIYSGSTATAIGKALIGLEQLRVQLWDKEKEQLGQPDKELTKEDQQVISQVARLYENKKDEQYSQHVYPYIPRSFYGMRSAVVRDNILNHAVMGRESTLGKHDSGSKTRDLTPLEGEIVNTQEEVLSSKGPTTKWGQSVAADLEDLARRSPPSFMERLKMGAKSFQQASSMKDLRNGLIDHIFSTIISNDHGELGNIIQGMDISDVADRLKWTRQGTAKQFVVDLAHGASVDEALGNISQSPSSWWSFGRSYEMVEVQPVMRTVFSDLSNPIEQANVKLKQQPPGVYDLAEKDVDMRKVAAEVDSLKKELFPSTLPNDPDKMAGCLATYSDNFPGQVGVEKSTLLGNLTKQWESSLPPNILGAVQKEVQSSETLFRQAHDFKSLEGYSKVGGIIIGRAPSDAQTNGLDVTDIRWKEVDDGRLQLVLIKGNGEQVESRPYRKSLVYYALAYAADSRPLMVTIINGGPLYENKVMLHPTLVDTALGQRMIDLDQFVFQYAESNEATKKLYEGASKDVKAQKALYQYAWARRIISLNSDQLIGAKMLKDSWELWEANRIIKAQYLLDEAQRALQKPEQLGNPRYSPLTVKKEFFDESLVEVIISAPKGGTGFDQLDGAIYTNTRAKLSRAIDEMRSSKDETKFNDLLDRWLSPPPEFEFFSGVREKEFTSENKNILMMSDSDLRPFDFVLQIEFTTPPRFLSQKDSASSYTDTRPWGFPALKEKIQDQVLGWAEAQPLKRVTLDDAAEFTAMQRLFRMAFDGNLGGRFPVEKLSAITETAAPSSASMVRTLRWDDPSIDEPSLHGATYYQVALQDTTSGINTRQWLLYLSDMLRPALSKDPKGNGKSTLQQIIQIRSDLNIERDRQQRLIEREATTLPELER